MRTRTGELRKILATTQKRSERGRNKIKERHEKANERDS